MPLIHVRFQGASTTIDLPPSFRSSQFRLKSYRVLFNREDHGFHVGSIKCTLFNDGNIISFTRANDPTARFIELPLILDPEKKQTHMENVDWNLGTVRNASNVKFEVAFENCIQRSRFDLAYFNTTDSEVLRMRGISPYAAYFAPSMTMYPNATANFPDQRTISEVPPMTPVTFGSTSLYAPNGTLVTTDANPIFPSATTYVHTGVQVGNVDPQPGGLDYTTDAVNVDEALAISNSGNALTGSGFRRNAVIYCYALDLVFEYDLAT